MRFDVFNGDADGICALHQLRLDEPADAVLITGVKRDNRLLSRVPAGAGDEVTVLDIGLDRNREALLALLERGVRVHYVDHHYPGDIPAHPLLTHHIDTAKEVCTSVIADRLVTGRHRPWAVVGAFGDNLAATARKLAAELGTPADAVERWRDLGECLNYNAYGDTEADLICPPAQLYRMLSPYHEPDDFVRTEPLFERLHRTRAEDMGAALALAPAVTAPGLRLYRLPDVAWSRRVVGSFANHLARTHPEEASAVLVPDRRGRLSLSLRVPGGAPVAADEFCRRWGGGGRRIAAGADALPVDCAHELALALRAAYGRS
jgi:hypothetical protein